MPDSLDTLIAARRKNLKASPASSSEPSTGDMTALITARRQAAAAPSFENPDQAQWDAAAADDGGAEKTKANLVSVLNVASGGIAPRGAGAIECMLSMK